MTTAAAIEQQLHQSFQPSYYQLINESHLHGGYTEGKESHFKLTLVSTVFADMSLVKRHQAIYSALANILTSGGGTVHALAIHAYTPTQWQEQQAAPASPQCASRTHTNNS